MKWSGKFAKPTGASRAVLRFSPGWPASGGAVDWFAWSAQGSVASGQVTSLTDLPAEVRVGVGQVWTAASDSLLTQVALPPTSRAKMLQALPFALEEQLASDPEQLHFCVDSSNPGARGIVSVAITGKEQLSAWQAALDHAGIAPRALCPITCASTLEDGAWTLTWDAHESWLRTGRASGFCCAGEWPVTERLLQLALNEARALKRAPSKLLLQQAPTNVNATALQATLGIPVVLSDAALFSPSSIATPFNLVDNSRTSNSDGARKVVRAVAPALLCLALWAGLALITDLFEWSKLRATDVAQREAMTALFRKSFPDAKTIVDPALQMERNLAQLRDSSGSGQAADFLNLLKRAAPALAAGGKVAALRYDGAVLQVDIEFPSTSNVESARTALTARGLKAELLDSQAREGKVLARLRAGIAGKS